MQTTMTAGGIARAALAGMVAFAAAAAWDGINWRRTAALALLFAGIYAVIRTGGQE